MVMVIPSILFRVIEVARVDYPGINSDNPMYADSVIAHAYSTMVELVLFTILASFFKKYFTVSDALKAMKNDENKSHNVEYSAVELMKFKTPRFFGHSSYHLSTDIDSHQFIQISKSRKSHQSLQSGKQYDGDEKDRDRDEVADDSDDNETAQLTISSESCQAES